MLLFFFVDDTVIIHDTQHAKQVDDLQAKLCAAYEMRILGELQWFLGIRVTRKRPQKQLILTQDSYIDKVIWRYHVNTDSKATGAPLTKQDQFVKHTGQASAQDSLNYQQRVGSINFAAVITRADLAFTASKLFQFLTNPSKVHIDATNQVLTYLAHTKHYSIIYDPQTADPRQAFVASSTASFADDLNNRYSSQGYCFKAIRRRCRLEAFKTINSHHEFNRSNRGFDRCFVVWKTNLRTEQRAWRRYQASQKIPNMV